MTEIGVCGEELQQVTVLDDGTSGVHWLWFAPP